MLGHCVGVGYFRYLNHKILSLNASELE